MFSGVFAIAMCDVGCLDFEIGLKLLFPKFKFPASFLFIMVSLIAVSFPPGALDQL